jgi:predicted GIY-YIG superfamily endonuclease
MSEIIPITYIMASQRNGTVYTGVTSNLLVGFGQHSAMGNAILREKRIKDWNRG